MQSSVQWCQSGVMFILITFIVAAMAGCSSPCRSSCGQPMVRQDQTPRTLTVLGDDPAPLAQAFNKHSDRWRVVGLVSPTCSECLLGASAVKKEIVDRFAATKISTLIVWIPMLDSDNQAAAESAATLFAPDDAVQLYDADRTVGLRYAQGVFRGMMERAARNLSPGDPMAQELAQSIRDNRPQWDLYMLYAPGIRWNEDSPQSPPMPTHWIRHCGRRDGKTSTYWQDSLDDGLHKGNLYDAMRKMADDAIGSPAVSVGAAMKIEILGASDCPNTPVLRRNVNSAILALNLKAEVDYVDQSQLAADDPRRGWPAPTVLVNGRDLFGMERPTGVSPGCRLYPGGGVPSLNQVVTALTQSSVVVTR